MQKSSGQDKAPDTNNATVKVVMEQLKSKEETIVSLNERLKSSADALVEEKEKSKQLRQLIKTAERNEKEAVSK